MTQPVYWLNLFSGETWNEFLHAGGTVTGFRESRWNTVQQVKPGDMMLAYVTGISRFVAILQVTSDAYRQDSRIWSREVFPCRVDVKIVSQLSLETAVPIHHLQDRLSIFQNLSNPNAWTGHVRGSPSRWSREDGLAVVQAVQEAEQNPVPRRFDAKKLARRPRAVATDIGDITIPRDDDTEESAGMETEVSAHTEIQWLLLKLGSDMGLDVWVARNDRGREINGQRFAELPRLRHSLPRQFDEVTTRIVEHIDVLWLHGNAISAAFEIESTTSIYSGLLRMADLIAMQPNLNIPLFIVAPDERRDKVIAEINRPTFARLQQPLHEVCRFIRFSELRDKVGEVTPYVRYLSPNFINEIAEDCGPDD